MERKWKHIIDKVVSEYKTNPDIQGIILFGSLAEGNPHFYSDIDLYVIGQREKDRATCRIVDGVPVQAQYRSVEDFQEKIQKQTRSKPLCLTGVILYDPTGLVKENFELAREKALTEGPKKMAREEIKMGQIALTQEINSIKGLEEKGNNSGAVILMQELLIQALDIYYDFHSWWRPENKHLVEDLKKRDSRMGNSAERVLIGSSLENRRKNLTVIRDKVLELLGGEISEYELEF